MRRFIFFSLFTLFWAFPNQITLHALQIDCFFPCLEKPQLLFVLSWGDVFSSSLSPVLISLIDVVVLLLVDKQDWSEHDKDVLWTCSLIEKLQSLWSLQLSSSEEISLFSSLLSERWPDTISSSLVNIDMLQADFSFTDCMSLILALLFNVFFTLTDLWSWQYKWDSWVIHECSVSSQYK